MAREKPTYTCNDCGAVHGKWFGQCPACGAWNSIVEQAAPATGPFQGYAGRLCPVRSLDSIPPDSTPRQTTGISELDRVLGGGLVQGSVVLLGGAPGIGKSTVLLQVGCHMSRILKVLYVSGEESLEQIALRSRRLRLENGDLQLLAETRVENIIATAEVEKPVVLVIDSIQTMQIADLQAAPGSVSQVRESAARLTQFAKQTGTAIFLVGHVTKSGDLAGPRVLEHIIDVVCAIESSQDNRYRILRAVKNRFGAVNELGVFAMTDSGMKEVKNPSALFLSRQDASMPGSSVAVLWEGSRPLLVEIQSLVDDSYGEHPRRVTMGMDQNRLVMLLAVLHRHGGLATFGKDVFINVAGGIRVTETAADLAVILAVASSLTGQCLPRDLFVLGEVGLAGEVRPVPNGQPRLQEAVKHGFHRAVIPAANRPTGTIDGLEIRPVSSLPQALAAAGIKG